MKPKFFIKILIAVLLIIKSHTGLTKEYFYEIFYGPFKIGEAKIIITSSKYTGIVYTVGWGNTIYSYYAQWETWVDEKGYPKKTIIHSKERNKERKKVLIFEPQKTLVRYQKVLPKPKPEKSYSLPFPLYDELSSFIASWKLNYSPEKTYFLPIYVDGERHLVEIKLIKEFTYAIDNQSIKCLELQVLLPQKSELLKRSNKVSIILSKEKKYPLELKGNLPVFGTLVGKIKSLD